MPIFPPNKGFKMPGVGSKNIDSAGNFRDEQHVDKVGYCDATEDSMLPELSNPLKARYTTSGYRKDLKEVDIDVPNKCPKGSKLVDGKCVESEDKPPKNKSKGKDPFQKYIKEPKDGGGLGYDKREIIVEGITPDKTTTTPGSKKGGTGISYANKFKNLPKAKQKEFGSVENFKKAGEEWWEKKNATTTTTRGGSSQISSNPGKPNKYELKWNKDLFL